MTHGPLKGCWLLNGAEAVRSDAFKRAVNRPCLRIESRRRPCAYFLSSSPRGSLVIAVPRNNSPNRQQGSQHHACPKLLGRARSFGVGDQEIDCRHHKECFARVAQQANRKWNHVRRSPSATLAKRDEDSPAPSRIDVLNNPTHNKAVRNARNGTHAHDHRVVFNTVTYRCFRKPSFFFLCSTSPLSGQGSAGDRGEPGPEERRVRCRANSFFVRVCPVEYTARCLSYS